MSNREKSLSEKAFEAMRRENMAAPGQPVKVALSGGADSVALLFFLDRNRERLGLGPVSAVHVNHGLRGEESERDEAFVRRLCADAGIPLEVFREDIAKTAGESGAGIEETGRMVRYDRLVRCAGAEGACVATAHTASDSVETLLFHMARGCGLRGLCGIPPVRDWETGDGIRARIIRPLIGCTRQDVEQYCAGLGTGYVTDSTNFDTGYARNRIRHEVLPQLTRVNPGADGALLRLTGHMRALAGYMELQAAEALERAALHDGGGGYAVNVLAGLHPALLAHTLDLMLRTEAGVGCDSAKIELLQNILRQNGELTVSKGVCVRVSQGRIAVLKRPKTPVSPASKEFIELEAGHSCTFYQRNFLPEVLSLSEFEKRKNVHKNLLQYAFSYDRIKRPLFLRPRLAGDRISPSGRGVSKSLKKWMIELRVPAELRESVPVVCDTDGVLLVGGFGCDERVRIGEDTKEVFVLNPGIPNSPKSFKTFISEL